MDEKELQATMIAATTGPATVLLPPRKAIKTRFEPEICGQAARLRRSAIVQL